MTRMAAEEKDKEGQEHQNPISSQLDCSGMNCPLPLIKTSQQIKKISPGGVLEVISTDPRSVADLTTWARQTGNEMLSTESEENKIKFYIRKKSE
jgi:tRNA 2-thiouridine synthesizing protein A